MEPVTAVAAWGVWKAVTIIGCAIAGAYATKKAAEAYGDTPSNKLSRNGISQEQQYDDYKKWAEDTKKFVEEKIEEHFKDLKDRRDKLDEENKKLTERLATATPEEKAKILEMISDNKKEISTINQTIAEGINKIIKNFETIGRSPSLTQEQYQDKSKKLDLGSWLNWGIIAFCVVIAILILNFVRKLLSSFSKNFG